MRLRVAACAVLLLAPVATAPAQKEPSGVVRESTSVVVIEVPVHVIGKDGKPLAGLKAADFELYDSGKKREISGFEVVDLRQKVAVPQAANPFPEVPPPAARRHWLLVFDLSYSSPTSILRARDGARSFVEKDMAPSDVAAVSTLSVEHGWKLVENFTNDRIQLARAIDTLGLAKTGIRTTDPLAFVLDLPVAGQTFTSSSTSKAIKEYVEDVRRTQLKAYDERERGRITQQVSSLGQMARILDSVRGQKHVLLFSEGFENRMLSGNAGQFETPLGETLPTQDTSAEDSLHASQIWKVDSDKRFGSSATRAVLADALSVFRRSDVVLDTVDISGLRADGEVTHRAGSGTEALFAMAKETNGDFIHNANELSSDLAQIVERTALVYILSFQPANLSKPGTFHELSVKVKVPASRVSCRSGYYEPRPYSTLTPIERVLASGDLLTSGGETREIPMHMLVAAFPSDERVAQVPVILEIAGKPLVEEDSGPSSRVQLYIYASDTHGTLTDFLTQEMQLDLSQVRSRLEAGGIKYYGTLFLPPGQYTVRALARNASTGRSALAMATVLVPAIPGDTPMVLPPFFEEPAGSWLMVKTSPRADASAHPADYPFAMEGNSFVPAAHAVIARGASAQVAVLTYNLRENGKTEPLQVVSEVLGSDGKPRSSRIEVMRRSDRERSGGRALLLTVASGDLEPGSYVLKVRVSDRVLRRTAEASSAFEVRAQ